MAYTILFRRGTDNEWTQANPVLKRGEMGFVTDTGRVKIGDGITPWNSLEYKIASLTNGKIPLDQLPDYVKIAVYEVSSIAQRDLLTAQPGDMAVVAEVKRTYVWDGDSWVEFLVTPDLSAYATIEYVDDSIEALNISQYTTSASVSSIVAAGISELNISQYATQSYVQSEINDLDLPPSGLIQLSISSQDQSMLIGKNIPFISNTASPQYFSYVGTVGIGDGSFTSSSTILVQNPSASVVLFSTGLGVGSMSAAYHNIDNTAVGYATLRGGGFRNVAVGKESLLNLFPLVNDNRNAPTTAKENVAIGYQSLVNMASGSGNTAIGAKSLALGSALFNNIALGHSALNEKVDNTNYSGSNSIGIGNDVKVPADYTIKIGNPQHVIVVDNPIYRYSDSRDQDSIEPNEYGLNFINQLDTIQYQGNPRWHVEPAITNQLGIDIDVLYSASPQFPGVADFNSYINSADIKAVALDQFIPPIIKSIQEVDLRLIQAENDLDIVSILSASVAALSASVVALNEGDAVYETYTISSAGTEYFVSASPGQANPQITLVKGRRYRFDLTGVNSAQPLALRISDQVTTNVVGTTGNNTVSGTSGSSSSNYVFYSVPLSPPYEAIVYQSVNTPAMGGIIDLVDP